MKTMNTLIFLALLSAEGGLASAAASSSNTAPSCGSMPVGFHEFAVFGGARFYLSHYAAFSSIHAYQVIAEVRLLAVDHDAEQRFRDDMAQHPGTHYTLSPYRNVPVSSTRANDQDDWVLPETIAVGKTFNADLHYTANGKNVAVDSNVTVQVVAVVIKALLDPKKPQPSGLRYVAFGGGAGEPTYLAHQLTAPPNPGEQKSDFDQIVEVHHVIQSDGEPLSQGSYLTVTGRANVASQALKKGEDVAATTDAGRPIQIDVSAEILAISVPTER